MLQINLKQFHLPYLQTQENMDLLGGIEAMELNSAINTTMCWSYIRDHKMRLWSHQWRADPASLR